MVVIVAMVVMERNHNNCSIVVVIVLTIKIVVVMMVVGLPAEPSLGRDGKPILLVATTKNFSISRDPPLLFPPLEIMPLPLPSPPPLPFAPPVPLMLTDGECKREKGRG